MENLTLEEFLKLDEKARGERYAELSDKDKLTVRISIQTGGGMYSGETVKFTEEEEKEIDEKFAKILVESGVIKDVEEFKNFKKWEPDK